MEKEVRTFRDKVGIVLATLGLSSILLGVLVFISWLLMPPESRSQISILRLLVVLIFSGIGLIRLSLLTVKK